MVKDYVKDKTVIIACGGTGGHIYPAITLKDEWKKRYPKSHVLFIGSFYGMERTLFAKYQLHYYLLKTKGVSDKKLSEKMGAFLFFFDALRVGRKIMKKYFPLVIVGAGGYASAPMCTMAVLYRVPLIIMEQNYDMGLTNKWFLPYAEKVMLGIPNPEYLGKSKCIYTGNPIRKEFLEGDWSYQPYRDGKFQLLVFGGSQGSHNINNYMTEFLPMLKDKKDKIHIMHQTGLKDYITVNAIYKQEGFDADVQPYFEHIYDMYRKASLVIARAGALTLSELLATNRPSILIPLMAAAKAHQYNNALFMVEQKVAWLMDERKRGFRDFAKFTLHAINNPEELMEMSKRTKTMARPNAVIEIANTIESIVKEKYKIETLGESEKHEE